jgi:hypothetical protein
VTCLCTESPLRHCDGCGAPICEDCMKKSTKHWSDAPSILKGYSCPWCTNSFAAEVKKQIIQIPGQTAITTVIMASEEREKVRCVCVHGKCAGLTHGERCRNCTPSWQAITLNLWSSGQEVWVYTHCNAYWIRYLMPRHPCVPHVSASTHLPSCHSSVRAPATTR